MSEPVGQRASAYSALKRELLFWVIAAAVIAGFIGLGHLIAPDIPPEPQPSSKPINISPGKDAAKQLQEISRQLNKEQQKRKDFKRKVRERRDFLRRWYQWGAGVGIVLVLVYTWWRPPWRDPMSQTEGPPVGTKKSGPPNKRDQTTALPISRTAMLGVFLLLVLMTGLLVLIAVVST